MPGWDYGTHGHCASIIQDAHLHRPAANVEVSQHVEVRPGPGVVGPAHGGAAGGRKGG